MNKKRGGKRPNAGRKKYTNADEYKEGVTIFVKKSKIKEHGGKPALKKKLLKIAELLQLNISNSATI